MLKPVHSTLYALSRDRHPRGGWHCRMLKWLEPEEKSSCICLSLQQWLYYQTLPTRATQNEPGRTKDSKQGGEWGGDRVGPIVESRRRQAKPWGAARCYEVVLTSSNLRSASSSLYLRSSLSVRETRASLRAASLSPITLGERRAGKGTELPLQSQRGVGRQISWLSR